MVREVRLAKKEEVERIKALVLDMLDKGVENCLTCQESVVIHWVDGIALLCERFNTPMEFKEDCGKCKEYVKQGKFIV